MRQVPVGSFVPSSDDMGVPLPARTQAWMESVLHADFSGIRVHVGPEPLALGAVAVARGEHLHFAPGAFRPETRAGRFLLGHELAHVLQQRDGRARCPDEGRVLEDTALEAEADWLGQLAADGHAAPWRPRAPRRAPGDVLQPIKLELSHRYGSIHGLELLALLGAEIDTVHSECPQNILPAGKTTLPGAPTVEVSQYRLPDGRAWLSTYGHLSPYYGRPQHQVWHLPRGCQLLVGQQGLPVDVDHRGVVLVQGTTGGASYPDIAAGLRGILQTGVSDKDLALLILQRMMGHDLRFTEKPQWNQFIDELIALMFGVESSRNKLTFMTALMLLDLIIHEQRYGRNGSKRFGLLHAFQSDHDWDNRNPETSAEMNYGGKFPMATFGTGSGTLTHGHETLGAGRAQLINAYMKQPDSAETRQLLKELELRNQRHGITRREITLTVHWLEMVIDLGHASINYLRKQISAVFRARLYAAYKHFTLPQYRGKVNPASGSHASPFVFAGTMLFWRDDGRFYHADPGCKTIPGQLQTEFKSGTELAAIVNHKKPCTACWPLRQQVIRRMKATYRCRAEHSHDLEYQTRPANVSLHSNCPEPHCLWMASLHGLADAPPPAFPALGGQQPLPELPSPPVVPEPMDEPPSRHLEPLKLMIQLRLNTQMERILAQVTGRLSYNNQQRLRERLIEFIATAMSAVRTPTVQPFAYENDCAALMVEYAEKVCTQLRA
ncbi:DUF4157 domain-containing protein [Corallococcus sp. CA053C]|uniref:eCIS core domain-containing protein n=1 Tax=Corallococcus sp. CA053C TaxID=2316732 RepID=UPI0013155D85|nr:DUF4157 domain-containing protein [Corallococcus sp. CA053C]